jgi:branched-chain amino acid transport system substrate-binding protein
MLSQRTSLKSVFVAMLAIFIGLVALPANAEIKIGFQAPLTGFAASDGHAAKVAAELAVSDINAAGGVLGQKLSLVIYDDQAKADQAIFTANKLVGDDKVKLAINGSYSASGRAASTIFQKAKVVFISAYGVHPDITRAGNYVFRLIHLGPPQGRAGANFVGKQLKLKRVSVVTMNNDYGESTVEGFLKVAKRFGIKVLNKYSYSLKDRQFGAIVASVKRDKPDAIYATGYFFTGGPLVSQIRAAGIKVPIIGSQAFDSAKFIGIAGAAANGVYIVGGLAANEKDGSLTRFFKEFKKRASYLPVNSTAQVYSSFMLMADAIKRAGSTDPAKVRAALAATSNFRMLGGAMLAGFSPQREVVMPMAVTRVKDGKFSAFSSIDDLKLLGKQ